MKNKLYFIMFAMMLWMPTEMNAWFGSSWGKSISHFVTKTVPAAAKTVGNSVAKVAKEGWSGTKAYFTACSKYNHLKSEYNDKLADLTKKQSSLQAEQEKYEHENSQYESVEKEYQDLQKSVATEKAAAKKAKQELTTARNDAFNSFKAADVWLKGRLGKIINKSSSVSFKLVYSQGGKTVDYPEIIAPGQTKYVKIPFKSTVAKGKKVAEVMILIPYVNGQQTTKSHAESDLVGKMYGIAFNVQSVNTPGHPYGYVGGLCVTRMYPSVATRAHAIDISSGSLISDTQFWEADITIDEINNGFVYPRISTVRTQTEAFNADADLPTISSVTISQTSTNITKANSSTTWSYPSWNTSTGQALWKDLPNS